MIKFLSVLSLFTASFYSYGQTFFNTYAYADSINERGKEVDLSDSYMTVVSGAVCKTGSDCTIVHKLNCNGYVIDSAVYDFIDAGRTSVVNQQSDLYIAGHTPGPVDKKYLLFKVNADLDSSTLYPIPFDFISSNPLLYRMSKHNEYLLLAGNDIVAGQNTAFLTWTDYQGQIIEQRSLAEGVQYNAITDLHFDEASGEAVVCYEHEQNAINRTRTLLRYSAAKEVVWRYDTDFTRDDFPCNMDVLDNEDIVISDNVGLSSFTPAVVCIGKDSLQKWRYEFSTNDDQYHILSDLSHTAEGDILGCGTILYRSTPEGAVRLVPHLFKLSADGDLIWRRRFLKYDATIDDVLIGRLFNIKELPGGDLIMTGGLTNIKEQGREEGDILLIRTDADGCLEPGCAEEIVVSTADYQHVDLQVPVRLLTTLVTARLSIAADIAGDYTVQVHSPVGQTEWQQSMYLSGTTEIDVPSLRQGLHYLSIYKDRRLVGVFPFVKQ